MDSRLNITASVMWLVVLALHACERGHLGGIWRGFTGAPNIELGGVGELSLQNRWAWKHKQI